MRLKFLVFLVLMQALLGMDMQAQQRDRRADLELRCRMDYAVTPSGRLWIATACGMIYTADNIHSTWHTVKTDDDYLTGLTFERVAPIDEKTAVVAGFLNPSYNYVMRTTSCGMWWDTVFFDKRDHWIHGMYCDESGRIWMSSALGRKDGAIIFSDDKGASFKVLNKKIPGNSGVEYITMVDADSGMAGTYYNQILTTSNNWKTINLMPTPMDQLMADDEEGRREIWVTRIQPWNDIVIATQGGENYYTEKNKLEWKKMPVSMYNYKLDRHSGLMWAVTDSSRLMSLRDIEHRKLYPIAVDGIVGFAGGYVYCHSSAGVLRIDTLGNVDTCGYYTTERPIEKKKWGWMQLGHGKHVWASDGNSIYILDDKGWYRVCKPGDVKSIKPATDSEERIIVCHSGGQMVAVDTAGRITSFRIDDPLRDFTEKGLQYLQITTFNGGCFHYETHDIAYQRRNGNLYEVYNTVDSGMLSGRQFPAEDIEKALRGLGLQYDKKPMAADFGLEDTTVNVSFLWNEFVRYSSTNYCGYIVILVNAVGDTIYITGQVSMHNEFGGRTRFPWLLPMTVDGQNLHFISYQPCLWQALKPMMPERMMLRNYLDNKTIKPHYAPQSGDLFFVRGRQSDMEKAITASTGQFTHVAMAEVDTVGQLWIIEATTQKGVQRIKYSDWYDYSSGFDIYRLKVPFDVEALLKRAKSFIGQPYDDNFLPDNGKMYCSELIYEVFLDSVGNHLFQSRPMVFRDKKGRIPRYWKRHFRKLGQPVPESVPGTNPSDMSQSPILEKVL